MPAPGLHKLDRAFKAVRIGAVRDLQRVEKRIREDGLVERDEQVQFEVSGVAEEFFAWNLTEVNFTTIFVNASGQRDSPFSRPHVNVGAELYTSTPVALTAVVMGWKTNERDETLGAKVALGVASTDRATKFRGAVHLTFQGFGQPLNTFDDQELTS